VLAPAAFVTVLAALLLCVAADRTAGADRRAPSPA
jgi:hypothetical protein